MIFSSLTAASEPAGGAEITEVVLATAGAMVATALLVWLCAGHRSGRVPFLGRTADFAQRISGLPGWAALPAGIGGASLHIALLGMYWDIALHIDEGRDAGPLANPAHYLILIGLFGIFAAGVIAIALPKDGERPGPNPIRVADGWYAPIGGVLTAAAGAFALTGFPLDDMWHRLFGQDVTLWGPTHLMLIGGAGMTLIGLAIILREGMHQRAASTGAPRLPAITNVRRVALMGGLLIGASTFQAEFDFGVPQFRLVLQPLLIAFAAGFALVAARIWIGRGGAIGAAVFFLAIRGLISLLVGPVFGQTTPALPLYLGSAVAIEIAAIALARRPLALGIAGGLLVGTVGTATEWAWSHAVMPLPWSDALLPEGPVLAIAGGLAGAVLGTLLATGLRGELMAPRPARALTVGAIVVLMVCMADGLITTEPRDATVTIATQGDRATVRVDPPQLADDAAWVTVTGWQGGGLVVDRLERVSAGVYRSTEPMPLTGEWKTLVRIQSGRGVLGAPVRLPEDAAIPAPEVLAKPGVPARLVDDTRILQREQKQDVAGWMVLVAHLIVLAIALAFAAALSWGVGRVGRGTGPSDQGAQPPRRAARGGGGVGDPLPRVGAAL